VTQPDDDGAGIRNRNHILTVYSPHIPHIVPFVAGEPELPAVIIHIFSFLIGQVGNRCERLFQIGFRDNLFAIPIAIEQEQLAKAGKITGVGIKAAICLFDAV